MNRRANILIAAIAAITSIPVVAADSPKERYGIDKTCAAVSAVAIEQNDLPANITANQAIPVAALYLKRTQASGERVGLDPATISRGIDAVHQSIVAKLTSSDTKRAITERSDTARMMENCTALVGFELLGSVAAH